MVAELKLLNGDFHITPGEPVVKIICNGYTGNGNLGKAGLKIYYIEFDGIRVLDYIYSSD